MHELRIYTLDDESLKRYRDVHYRRHLENLPDFGITVHGIWTAADGSPRLYVLLSYPPGSDPGEIARAYLASPQLGADMEGFDTSHIRNVERVRLDPAAFSPLR